MTLAWVFPGQGSQVVGMGRDIYTHSAAARQRFAEANAVLGFDLTGLCFEGPEESLLRTENAQPALVAVGVALLAALGWQPDTRSALEQPQLLAGHSLGEYTALYAAGALDYATTLRLVRQRGELMAAASEGSMAAVLGLDLAVLRGLCAEASGPVVVANENAPGQLVISGARAAVAEVSERAKQSGAKRVMALKVSAAFHSPLMAATARELAAMIASAPIQAARIPVVSNVTATPLTEPEAIRAELVAQITAPVKWIDSIKFMAAQGVQRVIEIGPEKVLTGLIKRIVPDLALQNVADAAGVQALQQRGL